MKCSRCGQVSPPGAAFCSACGQPLAAQQTTSQGIRPQGFSPTGQPVQGAGSAVPSAVTGAFQSQQVRQRQIAVGIGVLFAILAILAGLTGAGLLKIGSSQPDKSLVAGSQAPPPTLRAEAPPTEAVTKEEVPVMPDDVRKWLEHLEKCEAAKVEISLKQQAEMVKFGQMASVLGAGVGLMNPYDQTEDGDVKSPDKVTQGKFVDLKPDWDALIEQFHSLPPPKECEPIAGDFDRAIGEIPGMTSDIVDVLNTASTDPSSSLEKINKLKAKSYNDIDRYFARCDERVADICKKYATRKWFNIKSDVVGAGSLTKMSP